jgi:serine/threonine protein phosphatase PrpC
MLARLRGMTEALKQDPAKDQEEPAARAVAGEAPEAERVAPSPEVVPEAAPVAEAVAVEAPPLAAPVPPTPEGEALSPPGAGPKLCPHCGSPRTGALSYCENCGWIFQPDTEAAAQPAAVDVPAGRVKERYQVLDLITERGGISRYHGLDHGAGAPQPVPVVVLRSALPRAAEPVLAAAEAEPAPDDPEGDGEVLPSFDEPEPAVPAFAEAVHDQPAWPGLGWEADLLQKAADPVLPAVVDRFTDEGWEYLVEEVPTGQSFWEAWDDPASTAERRFGWLKQVAVALEHLHQAGAIVEGLRPDLLVVTSEGRVRLTDLADLLPLPVPAQAPVRATPATAPELMLAADQADARADLYGFGALLYALHVGRELTEMDFDRPGVPKPFIPRFPDVHPLLGRLVSKTFCREVELRFPSDEAVKEDPTGFAELIRTLETCGRTLDQVRLEIAAWTTTGMVRTGNEDAFALLHAIESHQDDLAESALVLLADGMGGYEAGEVAAALAIQALRKNLVQQPPFAALAGGSSLAPDNPKAHPNQPALPDPETCKKLIQAALRDANRQVYMAARTGVGRRGMGCTAEVVYVNGRHVVVGHVGDSRSYHLHEGRLVQLTRDQTLVNRLVELGTLTAEEAEAHPRRSELQQAIGGHAEVEPALYSGTLKPGDWVVVCSDGVSNHITPDELKQMLQSEATSAEMAARRLVNFVNIKGATDNATVVVVRAT